MSLIDERGRLFGKINLIDAIVGLFILVLIPLAYGAFLLFRVPIPKITSIQPQQVVEHEPTVLQISGEDFRPFLRAQIGTTESNGFLVQSPTLAEIKLPDLPAGTYDLILFDEARELLRKAGALTVVSKPVVSKRSTLSIRVHFIVRPEAVSSVKVGDLDLSAPLAASDAERAALLALESDRRTVDTETGIAPEPGHSYFQVKQTMVAFDATVRVPAVDTVSGWRYKEKPVKIGAPFSFETMTGFLEGWIVSMTVEPTTDTEATR